MYQTISPDNNGWVLRLNDLGSRRPKCLYYSGEWNKSMFERCACVIGSRAITAYGRMVTQKLTIELVRDGWTILSGMMYGVDKTAHETCLEEGGKTIAVIGYGIDEPGITNSDLGFMKKITASGGLVLSEWERQEGTRWTFPLRDRLMAAIAQRIYIVEAGLKSGSLITAGWGVKMKREIYAVPGPVTSRVSEGTNNLIASGKAKVWLPSNNKTSVTTEIQNNTNKTDIYRLIENETLEINDIAIRLNKSIEEVGSLLTLMCLEGVVSEIEGKYYAGKA